MLACWLITRTLLKRLEHKFQLAAMPLAIMASAKITSVIVGCCCIDWRANEYLEAASTQRGRRPFCSFDAVTATLGVQRSRNGSEQ